MSICEGDFDTLLPDPAEVRSTTKWFVMYSPFLQYDEDSSADLAALQYVSTPLTMSCFRAAASLCPYNFSKECANLMEFQPF